MMRHQVVRPDGATISATIYPCADAPSDTPLVFLPGWLCDAQSWEAAALRLSSRRTCITLDLPGFGAAEAGTRQDWSLAGFGADVAALIATLPGDRIILVGHSMGGAVALETAIAAPDWIERIVAVDSFVYPAFYDATPDDKVEEIVASFVDDFPAAVNAAMQAYTLPASPIQTIEAIERMTKADHARGLATLRDFLRWDVEARLARTQVAVSIIVAEAFVIPEMTARWAVYAPIRVDGVGHFVMLDDPAAFDRALVKAIGKQM